MNSPEAQRDIDTLIDNHDDFLDHAPIGFATVTPDDRIVRANACLRAWLGYSEDELRASHLTDLLSLGGKIYVETHLRPLLRMQGAFTEVALELVTKQGQRLPVIATGVERRDEQGVPMFTRFSFSAASDRKKYEQSLRDKRQTAETILTTERESAALREQFIAVLGHDLRNPLASINAGMRLIGKTPLDARALSVVDLVRSSTERMGRLIDDIMDFARGRLGGGIPLDLHLVQLEAPFFHVIDELRVANPGRAIEVDVQLPNPIRCDPGRLSQLLSNLVANALIHGSEDNPVSVVARHETGGMFLSVCNGGNRIPAAIIPTLFEPFTREKVSASKQGLGLGLYISSQIAEAHEGTLTATSDDELTCFTLRIPTAV